uniref:Centrosomal protein 89 n=1 Tax=Sphaeramia orbicularis TaxID=375764 RepID=A0A673A194_9TELE
MEKCSYPLLTYIYSITNKNMLVLLLLCMIPPPPPPPPRSVSSALAAAILSSSLTGQTWVLPPARPRSFSETDRSESFISEPNISTALYTRERWSEDLDSRPRLSSPDHSEGELEGKEEEEEDENEDNREDHVYQTLDRQEQYCVMPLTVCTPVILAAVSNIATHSPSQRSQAKVLKHPTQLSPKPSKSYTAVQKETVRSHPEKNRRMGEEQRLLEQRLQHLEQDITHSQDSSKMMSQAELQNLRRHAQELVDENDALKMTVHRLNVELSRYQVRFRPLPYVCIHLPQEEMKRLRVHVEEVIKENERLHDEIAKIGGVSQKDCQQLQEQAVLVLQENQVLIEQLEAQHVKAKANNSKYHSEVSKMSKQLMLLEAEKQRLEEDLEESRREAQKNMRDVKVLQTRFLCYLLWAHRQLEQQESRNKSDTDELLLKVSNLQEKNRSLTLEKADLSADIKRMETELELSEQTNRKAERKMSVLRRQKDESVLKEEKTRHYLEAVISVAEHISQERDQLLHMQQGSTVRIMPSNIWRS